MKLPKAPLANCVNCPLVNAPVAPSDGPAEPKVMLISRSPGKWDTSAGRPFSGPSGKLLDHLFARYGVDRSEVLLTNVVLCQTDEPSAKAIECCSPRLDAELDTALAGGCKTIIAGGAEATEWLLGDSGVKKYRGRRIPLKGTDADLVVTFNPAASLRQPATFPDLDADLRRALQPPEPFVEPEINWTNDRLVADEYLDALRGYSNLSADIEATSLSQFASLVCIGFAGESGKGFVFGRNLVSDNEWLHSKLGPLFRENKSWCWHNGKYDTKVLRNSGTNATICNDTLLLSYLMDERPGVHSLDYCLQNYLGWPYYTPPEVQWGKENKFDYPPEEYDRCMEMVYIYNCMDAVGGFQLHEYLSERLAQEDDIRNG